MTKRPFRSPCPAMCAPLTSGRSEAGHFPRLIRYRCDPTECPEASHEQPMAGARACAGLPQPFPALPGLGPCSHRLGLYGPLPTVLHVGTQPHSAPRAARAEPFRDPFLAVCMHFPWGLLFCLPTWSRALCLLDRFPRTRGGCRHHPSDGCPRSPAGTPRHTGLQEEVHLMLLVSLPSQGSLQAAQ